MKLLADYNLSPRLIEALAELFPGSYYRIFRGHADGASDILRGKRLPGAYVGFHFFDNSRATEIFRGSGQHTRPDCGLYCGMGSASGNYSGRS